MTDLTLTLSRDIDAKLETVWRCLTDADLLARWFAPAPVTVTKADLEPTPGGTFHVVMHVPGMGEMDGGAGCILVAEPEVRLVWTSALAPGFGPNPAPDEGQFHFTAKFELSALENGGTRYTATALHADDAARAAHAAMGFETGWGAAADQLADLAASL